MSAIQKHHEEKAEKAASRGEGDAPWLRSRTSRSRPTGSSCTWPRPGRPTARPSCCATASPSCGTRGATSSARWPTPATAPIAPDLRGYGGSSRPSEVADYGSDKLTGDLCGLLDHYGYDTAAFVGHDWGAMVVWEMGRLHPERVASLYNMSVPYSNAPAPPTEIFEVIFEGKFFYMLYFQEVGPGRGGVRGRPAAASCAPCSTRPAARAWPTPNPLVADAPREGTRFHGHPDARPPRCCRPGSPRTTSTSTPTAFEQSGFFGPVSFYRNMDANWERSKDIPASVYTMPTGFITGSLDPVNLMMPGAAEAMAEALPDFRGATVVEGAGPLGATGAAGRDQRRPAGVPRRHALSGLVRAARRSPPGVPWPTEDWPEGELPAGVDLAPLLDEAFDDDGPLATTLRRAGGPRRPRRGRALRRRARALRPPAHAGDRRDAAAQLVHGQVGAARRRRACWSARAGSTSTPRPPCPSGRTRTTPATPSRCASCWPCATGSTSWRTTSTTASPT